MVLDGEEPGDLVRLPVGATVTVERGLLLAHPDRGPDPPPPSWDQVPVPAFVAYEDAPAGELPVVVGGLRVEAIDDRQVRVSVGTATADVPRFWAARMLFRIGLHGLRLGYLETYGGLQWDDRDGYRLGVRGAGWVSFDEREIGAVVERLYRAVAPPGYTERPSA